MYEHIAIIGLVIAGLTLIFTTLSTFFNYLQIRNHIPIQNLLLKIKKYDRKIMFVTIILLAGVLIWQLFSNKNGNDISQKLPSNRQDKENFDDTIKPKVIDTTPLLVFAGGGSVRNYLWEVDSIDVREYPNSINIALASGSSWRVLAEEYQFSNIKNPNLNKFTTICLSADTMSGMFYSEYMSNLDNYIIASVYLGDDNLVAYISKGILEFFNMQGNETIPPKTLAQIIDTIIETKQEVLINKKRARVFTTTKTSGTLEVYKKCLSKYIDLEKMIDSAKVSFFYDNMDPKEIDRYKLNEYNNPFYREFIILGSQYYYVKDKGEGLNLIDSNRYIPKKMYLYFLAHGDDNQHKYKIDNRILKFLKMLDEKSKNNNIDMRKSEHSKWDGILKDGIIYHDKTNPDLRYPNMIQIN